MGILCRSAGIILLLALGLSGSTLAAAADPTAAIKISPPQGAWEYPVYFDALDSELPDGVSLGDLDIAWDFGDGGTGSGAQVTHTYSGKGKDEVAVTLTLTDPDGVLAASLAQARLPLGPQVSGKPLMTLVAPQKNATVVADDLVIIELAIDRATSGAEIDPATFAATLKKTDLTPFFEHVTDPERGDRIVAARGSIPVGQLDLSKKKNRVEMVAESKPFTTPNGKEKRVKDRETASFSIEINRRPTAVFSHEPAEPAAGEEVTFDAGASADPEGLELSYAWDFGDGAGAAPQGAEGSPTTRHTYAAAGDYQVVLTVSDGVWEVTSERVVAVSPLNEPPDACFEYEPPAPAVGEKVVFDATCSSDPEEQPLTFTWDYGDGSAPEQTADPIVTHAFTARGSYGVVLTVSDGVKADTAEQKISIGEAAPLLVVSPGQLDFGDLDRDLNIDLAPMRSDLLLEISNGGGGLLEVTEVSSSEPEVFRVVAGGDDVPILGAGEKHYVDVQFRPRASGTDEVAAREWAAMLTIASNGGDSAQVPLFARTLNSIFGASPRLMRFTDKRGRGPLPGSVLDFGDVDIQALIDEDGITNQGTGDVQITGATIADDASGSFGVTLAPAEGFVLKAGANGRAGGFVPADAEIAVTFAPTTTDPEVRQTARLVIATSAGDLEVGLVGVGYYRCNLSFSSFDFEFERVNVGKTTEWIGTDVVFQGAKEFLYPAILRVRNRGRIAVDIAAAIEDVSADGASHFAVAPNLVTLGGIDHPDEADLQLSFSPGSEGHKSALLRVTPTCLDGTASEAASERLALLHGYPANSKSEPVLGTSETWYTTEDSYHYDDDFDYVKVLRLQSDGNAQAFGDLIAIPDPFLRFDPELNRVDTDQWEIEQSDLGVAADNVYTIDSDLFGPYFAGDPENKAETERRLQDGETIGSGGILGDNGFIADEDGNDDVFYEGVEDLELDVTADSALFYTETSHEGTDLRTALKWQNGGAGVIASDLSTLLTGEADAEVVDLRVVQVAGGYRAFVVFSDALYEMDIDVDGIVTGTADLTAGLSEIPDENMRLDAAGNRLTVGDDDNGTLSVFKEDLHAGTGRQLFAQASLPFDDGVLDVLSDKQGNLFVSTINGIYWFDPSGKPKGYILSGNTYYSNNLIGNNPDDKNAEWFLHFDQIWFEK